MGSRKLKRRKCQKMEKIHKLRALKHVKCSAFRINGEKKCEKYLRLQNISYNRSRKKRSLSYDEKEDVPEVKNFSKIREDYFIYLQTVISDNCAFYDSVVTAETLKNLALELEQNALLACLQIDIYKKSMCRIIRDIKKSTEEKQVHEEVRKLLPDSAQEKTDNVKSEKSTVEVSEVEEYSRIPTADSIRSDDDSRSNQTNFLTEQSDCNSDPTYVITSQDLYNENQISNLVTSVLGHSDNSEDTQTNVNNVNDFDDSQIVNESQFFTLENDLRDINENDNVLPKCSAGSEVKQKKIDQLFVARSHLQKIVEETLKESEKVQRQKRDEQERAYIAQILEGDDSLDDRLNDSLSDNENDSKENIDESNLMDRLEKMKELFGVEEEDMSTFPIQEKPKPTNKVSGCSHKRNNWRYEKFIQLHKYSIIAGEMSSERRHVNRELFLEMFGEDSDEEHEAEYLSEEKYRSSCAERISSWVVKYLMPYYHDKRVLGRSVFKTLGHHISDTIVDEIQYPDEWTVKYFVSKFFPPKMKYTCDADVLNFQLD